MTPAPEFRSRLQRILLKFVSAVAVLVFVVPATAQPPRSAKHEADDALALRVRKALDDHPALRPLKLNLLVTAIDGVVVIGGPVPDAKLAPTIESAAAVEGVVRVKVSVWTLSPAQSDPLAARLESNLNPKPAPVTTPAPAVTLSVPTDPPSRPDPRPTANSTSRPAPSQSLLQPPVMSVGSTSRAPHVRPPGAEPPEYTPIPATNLPTEPVPEPLPATPVRAAPPRESAAEGWKRDPRFARLTVEVRGGTAVIGGRATSQTAAWELAEEVRRWPTVERVVVNRVDVGR